MAFNGIGLGGAWQGIQQTTQLGIESDRSNIYNKSVNDQYQLGQKRLQLEQQRLQNEQKRELFSRADKQSSQLMDIVLSTIQNAAISAAQNGQPFDVAKVSKGISGLLDRAKSLKYRSGGDPSIIDAMVNSQFATIQSTVNPPPKSEQKLTIAPPQSDSGGTPAPPGQNLVQPGETGYSVSYDQPEMRGANGQPVASPASSPVQPVTTQPVPQQQDTVDDVARLRRILSVMPKDDSRRAMYEADYKEAVRIHSESVDPLRRAQLAEAQAKVKSASIQDAEREAVRKPPDLKTADPVMKYQAEALLNGNTQVLNGMGFSQLAGSYKIQVYRLAAQMGIERGVSPEQFNANVAQFMGTKAGATAVGRMEAMTISAATKAAMTAPRVTEISDSIDRTQFPTLNSLILAYQKGTGGEDVVRLGVAINTFVNNYALAMGNGRSYATDSARKEAFTLLEAGWAKGQIGAAVDQMLNKELPSEVLGAGMSMKAFLNPASTFEEAQKTLSGKTSPSDKSGKKDKLPPPPPGSIIMGQ